MTTLGIIGAGKVGAQVARGAIANGYDVILSNSRGPDSLSQLAAELGGGATAATSVDAAAQADLVLVAIPTREIDTLPVQALAGKTVIDANNYYTDRDGEIAELLTDATTSSERLQRLLPQSHVVKTLNHIYAAEISSTAAPVGTANRRALAVFADDAAAKADASRLLDAIGFDVVDAGALAEGWRLQPGTPGYCIPYNSTELTDVLAATTK
jgi:8-hydroxy-5-deazaflavin:NADPH oxidoreductase